MSMASGADGNVTVPTYELESNFLHPLTHFFTCSKLNTSTQTVPVMSYDLFKIAQSMKRLGCAAAFGLFAHSYSRNVFPLVLAPLSATYSLLTSPMFKTLVLKQTTASTKRPWVNEMYTWRKLITDVRREMRDIRNNGLTASSSSKSKKPTRRSQKPSKYV